MDEAEQIAFTSQEDSSGAFTLVELLVVIGIIAVLAAILLPAMNAALRRADIAKASMEIKSIETAWKAYFSEYGRWPKNLVAGQDTVTYSQIEDNNTGIEMKSNVVAVLRGGNINGMNPKKIAFLELSDSSVNDFGEFIDPWDHPYKYMLDYNYNNQVYVHWDQGSTNLFRAVAVWSRGPDGADHNVEVRRDDPCGWK